MEGKETAKGKDTSFRGKGVKDSRQAAESALVCQFSSGANISQLCPDCSSTAQGNCCSLPGCPRSNVLPTRLFKLTQKAAGESGLCTRLGKERYGWSLAMKEGVCSLSIYPVLQPALEGGGLQDLGTDNFLGQASMRRQPGTGGKREAWVVSALHNPDKCWLLWTGCAGAGKKAKERNEDWKSALWKGKKGRGRWAPIARFCGGCHPFVWRSCQAGKRFGELMIKTENCQSLRINKYLKEKSHVSDVDKRRRN